MTWKTSERTCVRVCRKRLLEVARCGGGTRSSFREKTVNILLLYKRASFGNGGGRDDDDDDRSERARGLHHDYLSFRPAKTSLAFLSCHDHETRANDDNLLLPSRTAIAQSRPPTALIPNYYAPFCHRTRLHDNRATF